VGGDFNAFTSREHTCFHFYLPARELELGAALLKEILYYPLFAMKEVEKERQVILQEIAMVKENHEEECFDQFLEKAFGKHPLGRQILGSEESIKGVTRKKLFSFFYQHYRPENMVLSISGAVSFERSKRLFAFLGAKPWPNRKKPKNSARWGEDPPLGTDAGMYWVNAKTEQAHVLFGISAPVQNSRDRVGSIILQQHLGGGMSSVLFDQIREKKGWAYTVYANAVHFLDASLFMVYAGVRSERVLDTLKLVQREFKKIAKNGIPAAELSRIKDSLIYSFQLSLESSEARMMNISTSELFYKKDMSFKNYEKLVRSIKVKDLQKLMADWLLRSQPTVLVMTKKPKAIKELKALKEAAIAMTGKEIKFQK